jgi:hypothetical protein
MIGYGIFLVIDNLFYLENPTYIKLLLFLLISEDNVPLLSFKESDAVTIAVILENNAPRAEPAYATQLTIDFDERLDFIKKLDLVI